MSISNNVSGRDVKAAGIGALVVAAGAVAVKYAIIPIGKRILAWARKPKAPKAEPAPTQVAAS